MALDTAVLDIFGYNTLQDAVAQIYVKQENDHQLYVGKNWFLIEEY